MPTEKDWKKLNDFQHARLRAEMYISSRDLNTQTILGYSDGSPIAVERTWTPAVFTAFREVLDNALDEMVAKGHGDKLEVTYDEKNTIFTIKDYGRGIPINFDEEEQQYAATVLLSETKAGRNFEDDRGATRGMNGVGASIVNMVSEYFQLTVQRDRKEFSQLFHEGEDNLIIDDPMIMPIGSKVTGTTVEFKLSPKVFKNLALPTAFIQDRLYEIAIIYPKLKVFFNGERVVTKGSVEKTIFPKHKPIHIGVKRDGFESNFWLVPSFFEQGQDHAHSLVNSIPVFNGGTHIDSFRRMFFSGVLTALERESKRRKLVPNRSDLSEGMLIFNITEMDAPTFENQAKTRLLNEEVNSYMREGMDNPDFYKSIVKKYPEWIEQVYERCAERTLKKDNADASKLARKVMKQKIDLLEDAAAVDRSKCILFICEGRSAVSGIVEARDSEIHGALPLKGKIMNVHPSKGVTIKKVLEDETLLKIIQSIGLVPGTRANRHTLRYGKIYITTDADEDGKNIAALLANFFFTFWPELFDPEKEPFLYVFETPLIIASKGKTRHYWYADNYSEFDADSYKGYGIVRAKGLAALVKEDWFNVLANPKAMPLLADDGLKDALDLIFHDGYADRRKDWMSREEKEETTEND